MMRVRGKKSERRGLAHLPRRHHLPTSRAPSPSFQTFDPDHPRPRACKNFLTLSLHCPLTSYFILVPFNSRVHPALDRAARPTPCDRPVRKLAIRGGGHDLPKEPRVRSRASAHKQGFGALRTSTPVRLPGRVRSSCGRRPSPIGVLQRVVCFAVEVDAHKRPQK